MYTINTALAALGLALAVTPAYAQVSANNLVSVQLTNVANNNEVLNKLARDLDVNVSQIPVTIQAPIGIAANVCNVAVNVLAQDLQDGTATCDAASSTQAFTQLVQRQMNQQ